MSNTKRLTGLQKQDAYLTKVYSLQLPCPACGGKHSYIEARGSSDWAKDDCVIKCPVNNQVLQHNVYLLGEQSFSLPDYSREMSEAEEKEWQALNDNTDWMSDEQLKYEGDKIRKKYKQ